MIAKAKPVGQRWEGKWLSRLSMGAIFQGIRRWWNRGIMRDDGVVSQFDF